MVFPVEVVFCMPHRMLDHNVVVDVRRVGHNDTDHAVKDNHKNPGIVP